MPAMRYKVRAKPYETTRLSLTDMTFTVEFDLPSGFREAFQTTQEADFSNNAAAWPIGMNIPLDQPLFYTFKTNSFSVYNASEIVLNPLKHHLLDITLTCTGTPTITNKTTGDVFKLNKKMAASDTLLLNGCYPFLNGNRCGRNTNHGVITLAEGWNDFVLTGCENPVISFNTRFLYL